MFSLDHLHNQVIHFPIALFAVSVLFDFIGVFSGNNKMYSAALYTLIFGALSSAAAVLSGFIADQAYGHMAEPFPIFSTHGSIQITVSLIFVGLLVWRYLRDWTIAKPPSLYLIMSFIAVLILFYGAHLGAGLAGRY